MRPGLGGGGGGRERSEVCESGCAEEGVTSTLLWVDERCRPRQEVRRDEGDFIDTEA